MSRISVAVKEPLAPEVLKKAGVPIEDVLWFEGLSSRARFASLTQPRGERILTHVRNFMRQSAANDPSRGLSLA